MVNDTGAAPFGLGDFAIIILARLVLSGAFEVQIFVLPRPLLYRPPRCPPICYSLCIDCTIMSCLPGHLWAQFVCLSWPYLREPMCYDCFSEKSKGPEPGKRPETVGESRYAGAWLEILDERGRNAVMGDDKRHDSAVLVLSLFSPVHENSHFSSNTVSDTPSLLYHNTGITHPGPARRTSDLSNGKEHHNRQKADTSITVHRPCHARELFLTQIARCSDI
ncbi:hypothetical protein V8F06_008786 [Rhypophila decipiens]